MLTLLVAACLQLPSLAQVRQGMAEDMRKLTGYSDEWSMTTTEKDTPKIHFLRRIDGPRASLHVKIDGQMFLEQGYDGKNAWLVSHTDKVYADEPSPNKAFEAKKTEPKEEEEGSFHFAFEGPYDFHISCKPDLVVTALEIVKLGGAEVRKVTCVATKLSGKVEVELWFDRDRWRMIKAHAYGGKKGEESGADLVMEKSSSTEKYDAGSFVLEQSKVAGYEKKALADFGGGGPSRSRTSSSAR